MIRATTISDMAIVQSGGNISRVKNCIKMGRLWMISIVGKIILMS